MAEHTPGPWETTGDGLSIVATNAKGPRPIVARVSDMNFAAKTRHANARLLAAAPALLAACERLLAANTLLDNASIAYNRLADDDDSPEAAGIGEAYAAAVVEHTEATFAARDAVRAAKEDN